MIAATAMPKARRRRLVSIPTGMVPSRTRSHRAVQAVAGEGNFFAETRPLADTIHHTATADAMPTRLRVIRLLARLTRDNLAHLLLKPVVDVDDHP